MNTETQLQNCVSLYFFTYDSFRQNTSHNVGQWSMPGQAHMWPFCTEWLPGTMSPPNAIKTSQEIYVNWLWNKCNVTNLRHLDWCTSSLVTAKQHYSFWLTCAWGWGHHQTAWREGWSSENVPTNTCWRTWTGVRLVYPGVTVQHWNCFLHWDIVNSLVSKYVVH